MSDAIKIPGFRFSGVAADIKATGKKDVSLIVSKIPAVAAAVFTTNLAPAAPVVFDRKQIVSGMIQAVVINSGNANACTGEQGLRDVEQMAKAVSGELKISEKQVFVCSTGKIGVPMPMPKVVSGIVKAVQALGEDNFTDAAEAILTTDQGPKIAVREGFLEGKKYTLAGMAKGAGMIEPNMATMLAYVMTDLNLSPEFLQATFREAVNLSFNRISVDGDMSTNDTALILANGLCGNEPILPESREARQIATQLHDLCLHLAKQMVKDGEGATKCIRLEVVGASREAQARQIAYTIANSQLCRTSFFGQDPNWGRLLAATCRAGVDVDPEKIAIRYGSVSVCWNGQGTGDAADAAAKEVMKAEEFTITVDLHSGQESFHIFTSDLTHEYVRINAEYRT